MRVLRRQFFCSFIIAPVIFALHHLRPREYHVTNLNDSGPGSLRWGIERGHEHIKFDVTGWVQLKSPIDHRNGMSTTAMWGSPVFVSSPPDGQ